MPSLDGSGSESLAMDANSILLLQRAAKQYSLGNLNDAESICRTLLVKYPSVIDVMHLLALICKQRGEVIEAEELFKNCIKQAPQQAELQANLGNLYKSLHRFEDARQQYQQALVCDPSFRPARLGLSRLLNELGNHRQAEQEALTLLNNNKSDAEAWVVLAISHRGNREYTQAEDAYGHALQLKPGYAIARQNLGALLTQLNRPKDALAQLELAAAGGVSGSEIDLNRASALMGLGQFEAAIEVLASSATAMLENLMPADIEVLELLAKIRYMRGEENFAREFANSASKLPDNVKLQIRYSRLLQGADLLEAAENVLHDTLKHSGRHADIFCALAAVQQLAGNFTESLTNAKQANIEDGNGLQGVDLCIDALMSLGRTDEALPLILDARRRSPSNQWYIAMEAVAARLLGDPRYLLLYDYDKFVQQFELEPPPGWSTMEQFNTDLIAVLRQRHQFNTQPLDQSLRNGTQTPTSLLRDSDPVIKAFLSCLQKPIESYRERIGDDPSHPLTARNRGESELVGCWSVRLGPGGFHVNHVHPEGWISSAYYVETPTEIELGEGRAGWLKFGEPRFPIAGARAEKFVQPKAGRLVLFPSYMWHGTVPIRGDEPRMSIAFDVLPKPPKTAI